MIRDGFKDEKKVTGREARKIALMGERNYYAKQAGKLRDLNKAVSFTNKFSLIAFGVCYALILFVYITALNTENPYETWKFIAWSAGYGAFVIWTVVWAAVIKPKNAERADAYTKELERISRENLSKIGSVYKLYGSEYVEKIKREAENKLNAQKDMAKNDENSSDAAKDNENN